MATRTAIGSTAVGVVVVGALVGVGWQLLASSAWWGGMAIFICFILLVDKGIGLLVTFLQNREFCHGNTQENAPEHAHWKTEDAVPKGPMFTIVEEDDIDDGGDND